MLRLFVIAGVVLATGWVMAASYLFGSRDEAVIVVTESDGSASAGTLRVVSAPFDQAEKPMKAVALEQIARVTDLAIPPPRNVSPQGTTGWPTPGINAQRVPGALPEAPPPEPPEPDLLHQVVVEKAGELKTGRKTIKLAHIEPRSRGHQCHDPQGRKWPCGQAAVTEMRMLIRGRSVSCDGRKGPEQLQRNQPRVCRIGPTDLGEWLITQGWVIPKPEAPEAYRAAHLAAQQNKRGIYGIAWGAEPVPSSDAGLDESPAPGSDTGEASEQTRLPTATRTSNDAAFTQDAPEGQQSEI